MKLSNSVFIRIPAILFSLLLSACLYESDEPLYDNLVPISAVTDGSDLFYFVDADFLPHITAAIRDPQLLNIESSSISPLFKAEFHDSGQFVVYPETLTLMFETTEGVQIGSPEYVEAVNNVAMPFDGLFFPEQLNKGWAIAAGKKQEKYNYMGIRVSAKDGETYADVVYPSWSKEGSPTTVGSQADLVAAINKRIENGFEKRLIQVDTLTARSYMGLLKAKLKEEAAAEKTEKSVEDFKCALNPETCE